MIDVQSPKPKSLRILSGQTLRETICRPNFQIIQNDDRAGWGMGEREEESVFPLRWIGRTIDENKPRLLEAAYNRPLRFDIKRLD